MLKIVSGGQTGVDRAALDFALERGLACGGWCPAGRKAEDGPLDSRYPLRETESQGYRQRTRRNILDSDGTLILNAGELTGGTLATKIMAERFGKPVLLVQLGQDLKVPVEELGAWLRRNSIRVLNVAGPREGKRPGIYQLSMIYLDRAMAFEPIVGSFT